MELIAEGDTICFVTKDSTLKYLNAKRGEVLKIEDDDGEHFFELSIQHRGQNIDATINEIKRVGE